MFDKKINPVDVSKVVNHIPVLVSYLDKELRYQAANETYRDWFGWDPKEMIGQKIEDLIGPGPAAIGIPMLQKALGGEKVVLKSEMPYKQGGKRFIEAHYTPDIAQNGEVLGIHIVVTDISEKMAAHKALEESEDRFRSIFNFATVGIGQNDPKTGLFIEANQRLLDITGYSIEELRKLTAWDLTYPDDCEINQELFAKMIRGEASTYKAEKRYIRKDGRIIWVHIEAAVMQRDSYGVPIRTIGTLQDISSERQYSLDLQRREEYFREIVDLSPALIWITDAQSRCTYLSRQWYDFTGTTPETDLVFGWIENIHPEDKDKTAEIYFKASESKGQLSVEYRLRRKDGQYRWVIDLGNPRISANGQFLGYVGTVMDIHDRKIAEQKLLGVTERFNRSAKAVELGVWYCDLPFNILIWNDEVKKHFFLAPETVVTIDLFFQLIHPEDREKTKAAIQHSINNRAPYDIYYRTINPQDQNQMKWIRAVGWTDYSKDGDPIRFDGITLDATEEFRQKKELVQARDEAQKANQLKSMFLANMSHEIRTPLGAMIGFSDLLRDPHLTQSQRTEYVDILMRNGESLTVIINDILDLSKVEAGHLNLEYTQTYPKEIVEDVISLLKVKGDQKNLKLTFNIEESTPKTLVSDPIRVRQILLNLVGNAIKFTQKGEISVRTFGCQLDSGNTAFCFEVIDTGIGIPESHKERIFEIFVQADGSTTRRFGGTGLGLALSRRLARALGGDVSIKKTSPNEGTTFLVVVEDHPERLSPHSAQKVHALKDPSSSENNRDQLKDIRILVVDDSTDNQFLISHYLKKMGALIDTADNGQLGITKALAGDYDVILMDIQMPEMDGYTATHKLRAAGYSKPIIALTAHAMNEVREKILNVGANAHLAKPIDFKDLVKKIAEHMH